jgi:hypothetical protein
VPVPDAALFSRVTMPSSTSRMEAALPRAFHDSRLAP